MFRLIMPFAPTVLKISTIRSIAALISGETRIYFPLDGFDSILTYNSSTFFLRVPSEITCFLPFLTAHYGEINVVDLRYYYDDLDKLIENREITDVLFLYNANTFNSDDSILNIEN